MKKINTNKLIALLAALCLMTSAFVGSTLAKYTTKANANDTARVAKWGITLGTSGTLFSEQYLAQEPTTTVDDTGISVQVADAANVEQNVVAPGTKNSTGMTFTIGGTPEVDFKFEVAVTATDIVLAAGNYDDATTPAVGDQFNLANAYNPVKFTLVKTGEATPLVDGGTLDAVETALEGLSKDKIESNAPFEAAGTYTLTWEWPFEGGNDAADTYLGNNVQNISFDVTFTATQLD